MSAIVRPRKQDQRATPSPHHRPESSHPAAPLRVLAVTSPGPAPRKRNHAGLAATVAGILMVAAIGYGLLRFVTAYGVGYERARLVARVAVIGRSLDAETIRKLTGREADQDSSAFRSIVSRLAQLRIDNRDCRFIYLMGRKDGAVIFLADATDPSSPDYSPPGEVYEDSTPALIRSFVIGEPFVEGPVSDRWGTWVSGLAPIRDPSSHRVLAVLGMDVNADRWRITLGIGRTLTALATGLLAWAILFFARRFRA